jgi:lipid-A-disaccharide synthase-like uncharacterized protein
LAVGFLGQAFFTGRFAIQWLASELKGASVFPIVFWYFSIIGAALLLAYAIYRRDPVYILGQSFGFIVYARNLVLVHRTPTSKATGESEQEPAVLSVNRTSEKHLRKAG